MSFGWERGWSSPGIALSGPGSTSTPETKDLAFWVSAQCCPSYCPAGWSTACEGPHCCCCRLRLWSGSSPSPPSSATSPHLCQPEAKAVEAQGLALVASGQWGSKGQGRALTYKGVIVAQASLPRWGTLAHPHPKVTATSFLSLSCSEGKTCGLGCGRGKNSKGPAGWGWCHHVS